MDYKELGLRCGLEIHQQMGKRKLFCACKTAMSEQGDLFLVTRKQRAVAGETGRVDAAAQAEVDKGRTFLYHGFCGESCLVDIDEEPPQNVNPDLVRVALTVAKTLKLWIPDQIQFMRKTIADGSVCSGFQRTALIGCESPDSFLQTSFGPVKVTALGLEEDACKIVQQGHNVAEFSLSRQGIPLVEISTGPDIVGPEHMKETARKIGMLLRAFPEAKRGLGTIRQDVNVSIRDGVRVEIKGAQDLKNLGNVVAREAERQVALVAIRDELKSRGVETVKSDVCDITKVFRDATSKHIQRALQSNGVIAGVRLVKFAGLVGREVQTGRRLGTEFSDRAKIATGVGGIFHSDELPKYGITAEEVSRVKEELSCTEEDAFVLVAAEKEVAHRALHAVLKRANEALHGVPQEVRKALPDGASSFLRPMPGAARMYPETDIKPLRVPREYIEQLEPPKFIEERVEELQHRGLAKDLAEKLGKSKRYALFETILTQHPQLKASYVAETLVGAELHVKRDHGIDVSHSDAEYHLLFGALASGKISKDSVLDVIKKRVIDVETLKQFAVISDAEIEQRLRALVDQHPDFGFKQLIGKAMGELRGKADGKKIASLLQSLTKDR